MVERSVLVQSPTGLHARPAALFVKAAAKFSSKIKVVNGSREVDAKSILGVLSLGAHQGVTVTLKAEGPDADAALEHLVGLIESQFGEA